MLLRKDQGGSSILHRGVEFFWKLAGDVVEVPEELAHELLSIRGAGYSVAQPDDNPAAPASQGGPDGDAGSGGGSSDPSPAEGGEGAPAGPAEGAADPAGSAGADDTSDHEPGAAEGAGV